MFRFLYLVVVLALSSCVNHTHSDFVFNVLDYGAVGNGKSDDTQAIQNAINACSRNGGGKLVFPKGYTFISGPIELYSNIEYHFEAETRLLANPDESVYKISAFGENEGEGMMWIYGKDLKNISFTGFGTIDGNGVSFMGEELSDSYELKPVTDFDPRPHVLTLINSEKVVMRDINIRNSAYWTVHLVGCNDVVIDGISLLNNLKIRNGDGIDIDHSKNVRISNCFIESGDDCICLKNRREFEEYGVCEDIVVTNCIMTSRSCAVKIGSENVDSIRRVTFDNCIIRNSNRGIGIQNRDEGTVSDVLFSNMIVDCHFFSDVWWGKSEPIYITSYSRAKGNHKDAGWRFPKGASEGKCGNVSDIIFQNISCTSENGVFIGGETKDKIKRITLNNVNLKLRRITDYPGAVYDKRPCKDSPFISDKKFAFFIDEATDVYIINCNLIKENSMNDYKFINKSNK